MNEIINRLNELANNCGDNRGLDGGFLSDEVHKIRGLLLFHAKPPAEEPAGETNSQRVRRLIAAGNYSI